MTATIAGHLAARICLLDPVSVPWKWDGAASSYDACIPEHLTGRILRAPQVSGIQAAPLDLLPSRSAFRLRDDLRQR